MLEKLRGYYNLKDTYYIQVGTHGFFLLGSRDPLKLNQSNRERGLKPIPQFSASCNSTARIRCQVKRRYKSRAEVCTNW